MGGGPDVCRQLRERLPEDWQATLLALDGSVTRDVLHQLRRLPRNPTHLIVSAGGNDAVNHLDLLSESASSVSQVLDTLWEVAVQFRETYRQVLAEALSLGLATAAYTIYYPAFDDPVLQ